MGRPLSFNGARLPVALELDAKFSAHAILRQNSESDLSSDEGEGGLVVVQHGFAVN